MIFKNKKCHEVEKGRPDHRLERREHFCRNDGSYRIGRIMKAVDEIKGDREKNNYYKNGGHEDNVIM